ncbi:unnamed protein product [Vitrella brassicaformis CCMP3155]|uniref:Uncharacterized protein n=2 Tax=Vitrella brassicaformis TaxID=1169539 RepID=A0A0G4G4K9_VITBC|nr:unnamed protein product [Vitrella brassicaformis CCMP3155]|eukprot:CEM23201.1 unnamed protein product [Vitrella brassicaformis CCMP3155]
MGRLLFNERRRFCSLDADCVFTSVATLFGLALIVIAIVQVPLSPAPWGIYHMCFLAVGGLLCLTVCISSVKHAELTPTVLAIYACINTGQMLGWLILLLMDLDNNNEHEVHKDDVIYYGVAAFCLGVLSLWTKVAYKQEDDAVSMRQLQAANVRGPCCLAFFNFYVAVCGIWLWMMAVPTINETDLTHNAPVAVYEHIVTGVLLFGSSLLALTLLFKSWAVHCCSTFFLLLWSVALAVFALLTGVNFGIEGPNMFRYRSPDGPDKYATWTYVLSSVPLFLCFLFQLCLVKRRPQPCDDIKLTSNMDRGPRGRGRGRGRRESYVMSEPDNGYGGYDVNGANVYGKRMDFV